MKTREQLGHDVDELGQMLPIWLEKLRDPTHFWPQFDALSQAILDDATPADAAYVHRQLELLLQRHGLKRMPGPPAPGH